MIQYELKKNTGVTKYLPFSAVDGSEHTIK